MQFGDGTFDHLFAPDLLLPAQYFAQLLGGQRSCEQELVLGVLESAVRDFQWGVGATSMRRIREGLEAELWLFDDDAAHPSAFSFAGACEALGIDPDYLRRGLREWKERGGTRIKHRAAIGHTPNHPITPSRPRRSHRKGVAA